MNWLLWVPAFVVLGVPVGALLLDRLFDVPAPRVLALAGLPAAAIFVAVLIASLTSGDPISRLLIAGLIGGILGTVALDIVRLIGVRFGAFPADMPTLFGLIALGLAPVFQCNLIATMVEATAPLPDPERRRMMEPRVRAMATLTSERRTVVVQGMMTGLGRLPDDQRQAMLQTQMALLAELPGDARRAIMRTMDEVGSGVANPASNPSNGVYAQPRGMPRIPMATFRELADQALPRALADTNTSLGHVRLVGYTWHVLIGATFGLTYTLLFGAGSWPLAIGWGIFVWVAMMVAMPPMMPMIRFPWWFPGVPLLAHLAMAVPIALAAFALVTPDAAAQSLIDYLRTLSF